MSYNEYRTYLVNPTAEVEQKLYDAALKNEIPVVNIASLAYIPSMRLFIAILGKLEQKDYASLLEALLPLPNRYEHIRYLLRLNPELHKGIILVKADKESNIELARQQALAMLANQQMCICYFDRMMPVKSILPYGFFPYNLSVFVHVLENINVPIQTLRHHYNDTLLQDQTQSYKIGTEDYCRIQQSKSETTVLFMWFYPHRLYSSNRIKTDMSMFRTPASNVGSRSGSSLSVNENIYSILPLVEGVTQGPHWLPVTRYAKSLHAGLYHDLPQVSYCGTFYYLEDESSTCLVGNSFLVAQTKYSAMKYILENYNIDSYIKNDVQAVMANYISESHNRRWEEGDYSDDLMLTPIEVGGNSTVPQVPIYQGKELGLYAEEDVFDQRLCSLTFDAGIDLVVLTRMVGSHQVVKEILDTRSRQDSFKNLVFTN